MLGICNSTRPLHSSPFQNTSKGGTLSVTKKNKKEEELRKSSCLKLDVYSSDIQDQVYTDEIRRENMRIREILKGAQDKVCLF